MLPLIQEKREALAELCRRYHVKSLALFGSALRDDFNVERSDLDFIVEFGDIPVIERADAYFGLLKSLEGLFRRKIDLLEAGALRNPFLRREITHTEVKLYAA